jgi:hypothetical protein
VASEPHASGDGEGAYVVAAQRAEAEHGDGQRRETPRA